MKYLTIILMVLLIQTIYATCSENQIDINSASLEELDNLEGVGTTIAQYIIDARPFGSVDDLTNAKQIGEGRLEKIKAQGLACVEKIDEKTEDKTKEDEDEKEVEKDEEKSDKKDKDSEEDEDSDSDEDKEYENLISSGEEEKEFVEETKIETIKLNSKDIKTENSKENKEPEKNLAVYGLLSFCVLLGFLFGIKKLKFKDYKNEFE